MRLAGTLLCAISLILSFGCTNNAERADSPPAQKSEAAASKTQAPAKPAADQTANEILTRLLSTYRQAKTYQDQAVIRLAFRQNGQPVAEELPSAVAYERPARLSVRAYQATVKSDGREFKARIEDALTGNVDNQVVVRAAPNPVKLSDLVIDPLLDNIISSRLRRQPIQLELLLESSGLISAFNADVACRRLEDGDHAGQKCFRVEVPSPGGPFVFWVDQSSSLLRRLDYPAAALVPDLASDPAVSGLSLLADLRDPHLNEPIPPSQFALDLPPGAKQMKWFAVPPRPLPSELFGQQPREFFFTRLDGTKLADRDLLEKTIVLTWYHDNPACEATLQQVSSAAARVKDNPKAAFFAIATDPALKSAADLEKKLADWNVQLPILRDLEAFGDKSFHIEVQPTTVVLDRRGCVQIFQPGGSPELADQLVAIVERLGRGEDLAAEIIEQHTREKREYDLLVARGGKEPDELLELPEAVIRQRSDPKKLKLQTLWTNAELKSPGNLLAVESPSGPRVLAIEGWRNVAELDAAGQLVGRHALSLPDQAAVTFLRTTVDSENRRFFAASAPLAPQVYLFDDQWNLNWSFPSGLQAPLRVMDMAFATLSAEKDAPPDLLIAGAEGVGLVALSLAGEARWRNSAFPSAVSLAVGPPDEFGAKAVLATGESGSILKVNRFGNEEPPFTIPNRTAGRLVGASFTGENIATYLVLSATKEGQAFAVGLSSQWKELWNYPLPPGVHLKPIEAVTSSQILPGSSGEWWLAGPDGSIHLITANGKLFDSFHYGAALTGLAATRINDQPTLLIATDGGLTAHSLSIPAPRATVER